MTDEQSTDDKHLKAAVHYTVGKICEEVGVNLGMEFSKQIIAALTETALRQCGLFAEDLEHFARHGRRTIISSDDVKLLVRRSPTMRDKISKASEEYQSAQTKRKAKKRKTEDDDKGDVVLIDD